MIKAERHPGLTHILCLDVETTGQNLKNGQLIELAATVWKIGDEKPWSQVYFYFGMPTKWCKTTLDEFWNNIKKGSNGKTPLELLKERIDLEAHPISTHIQAAEQLTLWARTIYQNLHGKIIVLTDTSGFDYQFITDLLGTIDETQDTSPPMSLNYLFGKYQPVRDINSWYLGMGGTMQKWGSRDRMLAKLNVDFPEWVKNYLHDHNPRNDANSIAAMASFILSLSSKES